VLQIAGTAGTPIDSEGREGSGEKCDRLHRWSWHKGKVSCTETGADDSARHRSVGIVLWDNAAVGCARELFYDGCTHAFGRPAWSRPIIRQASSSSVIASWPLIVSVGGNCNNITRPSSKPMHLKGPGSDHRPRITFTLVHEGLTRPTQEAIRARLCQKPEVPTSKK